ncbi:MAG: penicillin acylase family protein [Gemmatimonadaceae bacterium]
MSAALPPARSQAPRADMAKWEAQAKNVMITRDDWGIAHVHGKSDADAVFGIMYAQAEDDFNRVETNFINSMGRLAEAEGEAEIYRDLRMKLFINPDSMKAKYATSPDWLKKLMVAWADGLNFYLAKNPKTTPRVIKHFEPWMALTFSEGSIGGDIEKVNLTQLQAFYGGGAAEAPAPADDGVYIEPSGSNGIAISPNNTTAHHALLLINPHTSFFFRSEAQMTSDEGLNAYGASTWGQFFIYQGFNNRVGWMHTTSNVDDLDEYLETVTKKGNGYVSKYGDRELPLTEVKVTVPYKTATGMARKDFTVYYSQHGPIIRKIGDKWDAIRIMQEPVKALTQSYSRTKAHDYKSFLETMQLHTNSSNNTIFASADGDIAYFHGNFIPKRDPKFDWSKPVDGSDPATDWHGLLSVEESPHLLNPASGWLYNVNNWPWTAAGASSPKREDYPAYVENSHAESPRGTHAIRILSGKKDFTLNSLLSAAFDSYLPAFAEQIPVLVKAYDELPASNPLKAKVADQVAMLRTWDYRWAASSVPTSLAVFWSDENRKLGGRGGRRGGATSGPPSGEQLVQALANASDKLASDFGSWKTAWGDINRFQRINDDIASNFDDSKPSIPIPFVSSAFGSLASFGARAYSNTKKWYGTSGNSFVAVVEFGDSIRARAVTAGGESGDPASKHFTDEAGRYASGDFREVYFYPNKLKGHTERVYHPGA